MLLEFNYDDYPMQGYDLLYLFWEAQNICIMKLKLLLALLSFSLIAVACNKEDDDIIEEETEQEGENPEDPAAEGVLAPYDGTYNVEGDGHTRGTVIISDGGTYIDFDEGIAYDIIDDNVYDRIEAFDRYQIEFFDENNNQDRIRINLDPNDVNVVVGFDYDPGADEMDIISVTVVE